MCKWSVIKYHNQKINMRHGRPSPVIPERVRESAKLLVRQTLYKYDWTQKGFEIQDVLNQLHWDYAIDYTINVDRLSLKSNKLILKVSGGAALVSNYALQICKQKLPS